MALPPGHAAVLAEKGHQNDAIPSVSRACALATVPNTCSVTSERTTAWLPYAPSPASVAGLLPGEPGPPRSSCFMPPSGHMATRDKQLLDMHDYAGSTTPFQSRPSYSERLDKELFAAAGFNLMFTVATVSNPLKEQLTVWKAVHLVSEVWCWGYALRILWMRRPLRGSASNKLKPFVFQPGYVFSRMEEAYTWTWFSIMYLMMYTAMTAISLGFHLYGSSLPGSRLYLSCFPYITSIPLVLSWDPICCTDIFKEAAEHKGYSRIHLIHQSYYLYFCVIILSAMVYPVLWMLAFSGGGVYSQYDHDLYSLYALFGVCLLLLPSKASGFAFACRQPEANGQVPTRTGAWPDTGTPVAGSFHAQQNSVFPTQSSSASGGSSTPNSPVMEMSSSHPRARHWRGDLARYFGWMLWTLGNLIPNFVRSIKIIARHWRWMCALRPSKMLFAFGFLSLSLLLWPVIEIPVTESFVSLAINLLGICLMLVTNYFCVFRAIYADQEMILRAAEHGHNIGSGLVFQTASLLNALTAGQPLKYGYIATEERLMQSAAISCRWDESCSWKLAIQQLDGSLLESTVMVPRMQLYRALLVAWRDHCRFIWMDTISIPQRAQEDSKELTKRKALVRGKLLTTMTGVYATAKHVIVVDTEQGLKQGADSYCKRTWTLQECVMNPRLARILIDGTAVTVGRGAMRAALSGLRPGLLSNDLQDLQGYKWVLKSEEAREASRISAAQRAAFVSFASSRHSTRAADKAVALGQIFFQLLFESSEVANVYMAELALLSLQHASDRPIMLVDNSGWDKTRMTGSAAATRFMMGTPGELECGDVETWDMHRVPSDERLQDRICSSCEDSPEEPCTSEWWLCLIDLRGRQVPAAVRPGDLSRSESEYICSRKTQSCFTIVRLTGVLHKMRSCTPEELAVISRCQDSMEHVIVTWL